jgi:arylsulfatase A-like enzyme/tetratricopeptide (TPR) repeat protein
MLTHAGKRRLVLGSVVLAAVGAAAGWSLRQRADSPGGALAPNTNVLLVTVDTLRADHLAPYGSIRTDTPAIARLAREGVRFAAAYTPVPLTLPAHSSILTGLQPFSHGVRDNGGFYLDPSRPTLATILRTNGYHTAAFVSAFVLDSRWGLASGFDRYFDQFRVSMADLSAMARVQRPGEDTWKEARGWLDQHGSEKFFVWLHLFDPHTPYTPPEPYRSRYSERPYDGEIAYADAIVGEAVHYLEAHHLLDRTLVVFLSDHGEGLGDHGEDEHGLLAYDSTLHVPWIVRLPAQERSGTVIDRPVSLVDVAPTTLGLLGISASTTFDGQDLARIVRGSGPVAADPLYAETYFPRLRFNWSELLTVRDRQFKLIRAPRPELYDVAADPGESHDVSRDHADVVSRLQAILTRMTSQAAPAPVAKGLDPDAARRLGSLGYIGGDPGTSAGSTHALADPKDKTGIYRSLTRARELLDRGADREGVTLLQQIVLEDPDLEPARRLLRELWVERRQAAAGAAWFRTAIARRADSVPLLLELGRLELAAARTEQSAATLDRALALAPPSVDLLTAAAETQRALGHGERALELFRKAAAQTSDAAPRMRVAETLIALGRLTEADAVLSAALAADSHVSGAHYLLAQIAERQHDLTRAEREYRLEMTVSSWDYRAPFNLAVLLGAQNNHAEEVALLHTIPPLAPQFAEVYFYLAKALLDLGDRGRFGEAIAAAQRGLEMAPDAPSAPLGHYVLADIYRLQGRDGDAQREQELGRRLEQRAAAAPPSSR